MSPFFGLDIRLSHIQGQSGSEYIVHSSDSLIKSQYTLCLHNKNIL